MFDMIRVMIRKFSRPTLVRSRGARRARQRTMRILISGVGIGGLEDASYRSENRFRAAEYLLLETYFGPAPTTIAVAHFTAATASISIIYPS